MRTASLLALGALSSCALFGPSKEDHPRDVESGETAPAAAAGTCEGEQAPTLEPASFFVGPYEASAARPDPGTVVAFEGVPRANPICSQRGCEFECCDNGCGADKECPYALAVDAYNEICLAHPSFDCGGTDCRGFCAPFSKAPKQRYRFVGRIEYRDGLGQTPVLRLQTFCLTAPQP